MNRAVGPQDTHGADRAGDPRRDRHASARPQLSWTARRPTTSASPATTSTARRRPASRRAPPTASRSRPGTTYTDTAARRAPTTTGSPPRTRAGNVSAASNEATRQVGDTQRAERARHADRRRRARRGDARPGARRPTTSASSATPSTASTTRRLHAARGEPDRPADGHLLHRHDRGRDVLLPRRRRGRRRQRRARLQRGDRDGHGRHAGADGAGSLAASAASSTINAHLERGDRQRRRGPLQRPPLDHRRLHAERRRTGSPSRPATSYSDAGLAPGTYYYRVTAEDGAGNVGPASEPGVRHRHARRRRPAASSPPTASTRAAGTTTADPSGNGNTGTLSGRRLVDRGQFGNALLVRRRRRLGHRRRQRLARPDAPA